jgi:hypothetical protein
VKKEHPIKVIKSCTGNGTFELRYGTPAESRTAADTII